ncbi:MAG: PSP1 C-terminal domain-containing protein [Deltaproteobacteria bacterium]
MSQTILVRYGAIPEVARFAHDFAEAPARHERVVVSSHRGLELGTTLEGLRAGARGEGQPGDQAPEFRALRRATPEDEALHAALRHEANQAFPQWQRRIEEWKLELELLDIEWTLDRQKLVLYVLGGRGAETTKLALQAAAAGLAAVEVQPVNADGPVPVGAAGGCGSGGCGCH